MAQGERGGLGRARGGLEMAQDRNAPMALATSLEPWEKELQQAVNTCGAWRETQALVWLPARPPPPHTLHTSARARPTCRYLNESSVLRSNTSALLCRSFTRASSAITSCTLTLALRGQRGVRAVRTRQCSAHAPPLGEDSLTCASGRR